MPHLTKKAGLFSSALTGLAAIPGVALAPVAGLGMLGGRVAGRGVRGLADSAGGVVQRAFTESPFAAGMSTLGGMAGLYEAGSNLTHNVRGQSRAYQARNLVQQGVGNTPMGRTVLASSALSQQDFEAAMRIRDKLEKVAATLPIPKAPGKSWGPKEVLLAAALIGSVGTGAGIAQQAGARAVGALSEKVRAKTRQKRYQAMLRADPSLAEEPLARTYFAVLDRASPYMSGEPHLAAATVQNMISTPPLREGGVPSIGPKQIQDILNAEQARQSTRFPFLQTKAPQGPALKELSSLDAGI